MSSRILIVGAGAQGNVISGVLSKAEDVGVLTLGDIDVERAKEVAQFVAPDKIEAFTDEQFQNMFEPIKAPCKGGCGT